MAKKNIKNNYKSSMQSVNKSQAIWYHNKIQLLFIISTIIITYLCYSPALTKNKEFTNWDDPTYVTEQKIIQNLSWENIKAMIDTKSPISLNYHPVTMLSMAVNYHFSKLNPRPYVLTNILLHLLNTFLVFIFLYLISEKKFWLSALSSLFFGIHPMHVESVAWIAERKDVLYCFFFLLSCISYLKYLDTKKTVLLSLCYLFFILSCLSKAMAVVLPVVLILIDIHQKRKLSWQIFMEKVLLFAFAVWIGILAVSIQAAGAIGDFQIFTLWQRFSFASYGFLMYWVKLVLPIGLSAFYKYPSLNEQGNIPLIYNTCSLIVFALIFVPLYFLYKKNRKKFNTALFGIGFFIITISMVLQFISVGSALMADRYTYLPYIGSFFLIFSFINPDGEKQKTRIVLINISLVVAFIFAILCYQRVKIWENSEKLWTNVIEKYPYIITQSDKVIQVKQTGVEVAYKNRGNYYRENNQMDKAFADYNVLILADCKDVGAFSNMGNFYGLKAQEQVNNNNLKEAEKLFFKSIEMYNKGISIEQDNYDLWFNRGLTYSFLGKHQEAIQDFLMVVKIDSAMEKTYGILAREYLLIGNYQESVKFCNYVISKNINDANIFFYRGTDYINLGKNIEAIQDLIRSLSINNLNAVAWYNLSIAQKNIGQFKEAFYSAKKAKESGYNISSRYLQDLDLKARQ